jgi:hypothetical protein
VRTTLDIDDDLVQVARDMARQRRATMGQVVSELIRKAIAPAAQPKTRNGVQLFVPRPGARKPSLQMVNRLRDNE